MLGISSSFIKPADERFIAFCVSKIAALKTERVMDYHASIVHWLVGYLMVELEFLKSGVENAIKTQKLSRRQSLLKNITSAIFLRSE